MELSTWENASKTISCLSEAMPHPVSRTEKRRTTASASSSCNAQLRVTSPPSVNFNAFPTRLTRICRSRSGSPRSRRGTPLSSRQASSTEPASALSAKKPTAVSSMSGIENSDSCNSSRPASIFEKSSTSPITLRSVPAAVTALLTYRSCLGLRSVRWRR